MKKFLSLLAGTALLSMANTSFATVITDSINQSVYLSTLQSTSYTHNLNDDGFSLGSAISGTLSIEIIDDRRGLDELFFPEIVVVTVEAFDLDTGGLTFGSSFTSNLEVNALAELNADGLLDVTVRALLGDFYVGNSVLEVVTASVPEPTTLFLLGAGLLGVGATRLGKSKA